MGEGPSTLRESPRVEALARRIGGGGRAFAGEERRPAGFERERGAQPRERRERAGARDLVLGEGKIIAYGLPHTQPSNNRKNITSGVLMQGQ